MFAVAGETLTAVADGGAAVTVSVALEVNPSADALMVVVPAPTPVASPLGLTVATAVFDDVHVTPEASGPFVLLL